MNPFLENRSHEGPDNDYSPLQTEATGLKKNNAFDLFLSCGELSGDLALASLLTPLAQKIDPTRIGGVLGPHLQALGFCQLRNLNGLQVMGFTAVLKSLFFFRSYLKELTRQILKMQPVAVLCADYPGFHLRLAKELRKKGYMGRIIQYVCPTIWAWKPGRLKILEQCFDEVWGIFPFEKALFEGKKVEYRYVGNPSLAMAQSYRSQLFSKNLDTPKLLARLQEKSDLSLIPASDLDALGPGPAISQLPQELDQEPSSKPAPSYIGLFPGSRPKEIETHLPLLLKAAQLIEQKLGKQSWYIALASDDSLDSITPQIAASSLTIACVLPKDHERIREKTKAAIAVSGTVCLELALCSIPTVAVYQISRINYWIAKYLLRLKLKAFTLPNILLGKSIFPECMGTHVEPEAIAAPLLAWLSADTSKIQEIKQALDELYQHMVNCEKQSEKNKVIETLASWLDNEKAPSL